MNDSITKQVIFAARKAQLCVGSRLAQFGITAAEEPFFMAIQYHWGATQEELTALIGVDKAATARALRSLENKGFLTREQDKADHRQNRIYPTSAVFEIGPQVQEALLRLNGEIMDGLSEEEQSLLRRALSVMDKNLMRIKETDE